MMERLTGCEIIAGHFHNIPLVDTQLVVDRLASYEDNARTPEECAAAFEELAAYRAAEQDGTLLRLPCKVGDTVYTVGLDCGDNPDHTKMYFCWNKSCKSCEKAYLRVWENRTKTVDIRSIVAEMGLCGEDGGFGKTVFLTREAAEAALKEQEHNMTTEQAINEIVSSGYGQVQCHEETMRMAVSALRAQQECGNPKPQWISVKDRLPEKTGSYLVFYHEWSGGAFLPTYDDCTIRVMRFLDSRKWRYPVCVDKRCEADTNRAVTHWMPLPEPPKEEQK